MIHHYYWAKSNNETKKMKDMKMDIDKSYIQIIDLKESYERIKKGIPVPLRVMA